MNDELFLTTKVVISKDQLHVLVTRGTHILVEKTYCLGTVQKHPGWLKREISKAFDHAIDIELHKLFVA